MEKYLEEIKNKIVSQIEIEEIEIVDNSYLHKKHKFFDERKFHLLLKIKSSYLKNLSRVNGHKRIMEILKEDIKKKIHALEIQIK